MFHKILNSLVGCKTGLSDSTVRYFYSKQSDSTIHSGVNFRLVRFRGSFSLCGKPCSHLFW